MKYNPDQHHRRSIRLEGYDYSQAGAYYVTLVCKDRSRNLEASGIGAIVDETWRWLAERYSHLGLDTYIVMPNHLHGIILIEDAAQGGSRAAPTLAPATRKALGSIIGAFKTVSTKRINQLLDTPGQLLWQRNYHERIIRNEAELNHIRAYIVENPARWNSDPENPAIAQGVSAAS